MRECALSWPKAVSITQMCLTVFDCVMEHFYAEITQNYAYYAPNAQYLVGDKWPPTRYCAMVRIWCVICVILL